MWCVFGACRYFATVNQHECPLSPTGSSPVEETSLHQRSTSNSKDRNWGLFSLRNSDYNARGCDTDVWCLCEAGRFSYDESPWTPPLEGNSLHRRNKSVERPWGILSLFTTCLHSQVNSSCQIRLTHRHVVTSLLSRSFFLR